MDPNNASIVASAVLQFTTPSADFAYSTVSYRRTGTTSWTKLGSDNVVGVDTARVTGLSPATGYDYTVQCVSPLGVVSVSRA